MDNVDTSEQSPSLSPPPDDIPVALREAVPTPDASPQRLWVIGGVLGSVALLGLLGGGLFSWQLQRTQAADSEAATQLPSPEVSPVVTPTATAASDQILGHFPYEEAPRSQLATVEGNIMLRKSAARAFRQMQADARRAGVNLALISGFRTKADQDYLYFNIKAERNQTPSERAKVSAPPGYSEHHTGYAVDIGDGNVPATHLSQNFERTAAFRWLEQNAARYSFELSFPENNPQGVMYEPWHWRYVGDIDSLKTFYKARHAE